MGKFSTMRMSATQHTKLLCQKQGATYKLNVYTLLKDLIIDYFSSLSVLQASLDQVSYQVAEEDLFLEFCIVLEGEFDVFGLEVTATTQPATADLTGVCIIVIFPCKR